MKIFIIGCGSIGERHIKNLLKLNYREITAVDTDDPRLEYLRNNYKISVGNFSNLKRLLTDKDKKISIVSTPNHLHIRIASLCAKYRSHIFIEKPLSHSPEGIFALEKMIRKNRVISMVACNMRFYPAINYIKGCLDKGILGRILRVKAEFGLYLPSWRPMKDYRNNYGAKKKEGGGVLLDLYHEFDYLYWFFGLPKRIFCTYGKLSDLEINTEDNAEVILEYAKYKPFVCNLHLDYLQYRYSRGITIVGEKCMLTWNWHDMAVTLWDKKGSSIKEFDFKGYDINNMYLEEMKYFMDCVHKKKPAMTEVKEAKQIQSVIFKAKISSANRRMISV